MKITEQGLKDRGFILNAKYVSDTFRMYEKGDLVIEASYMSDGKWSVRKKIDKDNSKFIADVETFEDIEYYSVC